MQYKNSMVQKDLVQDVFISTNITRMNIQQIRMEVLAREDNIIMLATFKNNTFTKQT